MARARNSVRAEARARRLRDRKFTFASYPLHELARPFRANASDGEVIGNIYENSELVPN